MRTIGLDYGEARVGVAIDDDLGAMAHPRGALAARPDKALLGALAALATQEHVGRFVVGLPLDMKGGEGEAARKARSFAQRLADATGLEVELWDERLTTVQARRALASTGKRERDIRRRVDEAAAVTLLQSWLDRRASAPTGER